MSAGRKEKKAAALGSSKRSLPGSGGFWALERRKPIPAAVAVGMWATRLRVVQGSGGKRFLLVPRTGISTASGGRSMQVLRWCRSRGPPLAILDEEFAVPG